MVCTRLDSLTIHPSDNERHLSEQRRIGYFVEQTELIDSIRDVLDYYDLIWQSKLRNVGDDIPHEEPVGQ
jgi:hypothetical protein